jgi:hypothetical protein
MHESDALEFITATLRGFMVRIFKQPFDRNSKNFYIPLMRKIRAFIDDENGHWVKVKALEVIQCIEDIEINIAEGNFKPETPESCIDLALFFAHQRMKDKIDEFRTDKNKKPKVIHDSFPLPVLPNNS